MLVWLTRTAAASTNALLPARAQLGQPTPSSTLKTAAAVPNTQLTAPKGTFAIQTGSNARSTKTAFSSSTRSSKTKLAAKIGLLKIRKYFIVLGFFIMPLTLALAHKDIIGCNGNAAFWALTFTTTMMGFQAVSVKVLLFKKNF